MLGLTAPIKTVSTNRIVCAVHKASKLHSLSESQKHSIRRKHRRYSREFKVTFFGAYQTSRPTSRSVRASHPRSLANRSMDLPVSTPQPSERPPSAIYRPRPPSTVHRPPSTAHRPLPPTATKPSRASSGCMACAPRGSARPSPHSVSIGVIRVLISISGNQY
jgi:hypothetical protein